MKQLFFTLIITGMFTGFTACTDVLDSSPYNKPGSSTMWSTENLTDMGVAGIYANLSNWGFVGTGQTFGHYAYDQWGFTGQARDNEAFLQGTTTVDSEVFSKTWKKLFEGVHRANDAITNIPVKSPIPAEKKGRLVAEAKFLRAFHYYRLNELFRGVPIYLEPVKVEECIKPQDTEAAVWEQIVKDLTECIAEVNFPDKDNTGRTCKGAAYALRGKTYMQQKKWALAAADFAKVGECGYSLFQGGYKQLFTEANEKCNEMIFSVQNIGDLGYGGNSQLYCGTRSSFGSCWNTFLVSPNGVDIYENTNGTPFNWDDIIPGYNSMRAEDREVFFLRDTKDANGNALNADVTTAVNAKLNALASKSHYLPYGNEARIKKAYANRDPRLAMSVITPYATYQGIFGTNEVLTTSTWPMVNQAIGDLWTDSRNQFYYLHRKFVYEGNNPIPARDRCPTDEPLIRYADVVLLWAEALVEDNKLEEAAAKVNMVRSRKSVEMPPVTYASQNELREKVRNERRVEFLNEGINFFDEMRWRSLKDTKFKTGNGIKQIWGNVYSPYTWLGDQMYTWPAPGTEVEMNSNMKKTEGWTY